MFRLKRENTFVKTSGGSQRVIKSMKSFSTTHYCVSRGYNYICFQTCLQDLTSFCFNLQRSSTNWTTDFLFWLKRWKSILTLYWRVIVMTMSVNSSWLISFIITESKEEMLKRWYSDVCDRFKSLATHYCVTRL